MLFYRLAPHDSGKLVQAVLHMSAGPAVTRRLRMDAHAQVTQLLLALLQLSHKQAPDAPSDAARGLTAFVDMYLPALQGHLCQVLSALEGFVHSTALAAREPLQGGQQSDPLTSSTRRTVAAIADLFRHDHQPLARLACSAVVGGPERKHEYSLLFSLHKLASTLWGWGPGSHHVACNAAAYCRVMLLMRSVPAPAPAPTAASATAAAISSDAMPLSTTSTIIHTFPSIVGKASFCCGGHGSPAQHSACRPLLSAGGPAFAGQGTFSAAARGYIF